MLVRLHLKLLAILIALSVLALSSTAQNYADSLRIEINQSQGKTKADLLVEWGTEYQYLDFDQALADFDSAATIYRDLSLENEWARAVGEKVLTLTYDAQFIRANDESKLIIDRLDLISSSHFRSNLRNGIASIKFALGNPDIGFELLNESMSELVAAKDTMGQINTLESMAMEFGTIGSHAQSYELEDSALSLAERFSGKDGWLLWQIYNNAASSLLSMDRPIEARVYVEKAIQQAALTSDSLMLLYPYFTMGEVYLAEDQFDKAAPYFKLAGNMSPFLDYDPDIAVGMEAKSIYYALIGKSKLSDEWREKCLAKMDSFNSGMQKFETLELQSKVLAGLGQFEKALAVYQQGTKVKDTLFTRDKAQQYEELRVMYDANRAEQENEYLREVNEVTRRESNQKVQFLTIIICLVVFTGLLMTYLVFRLRKLHRSVSEQYQTLSVQNEQLKQLTAENELLIGIVAHDLKAPLNKIGGLSTLLAMQGDLNQDQQQSLSMIEKVLKGGQELVSDILILSEAGEERTPNLENHDLSEVIYPLQEQFKEAMSGKSLSLNIHSPREAVVASIHPPYLTRVLDNLLSNAIKFSKPGTEIQLGWGADEKGPWCMVKDNGPGIAEEEIPKMFKRFARLSNRPTAGESSSGLGLYIVKILLDSTKSEIEVETEIGKGTTFRIRLPKST